MFANVLIFAFGEFYSDRLPETMQSNGRQNHLICLEQGWNE